MAGRERERVEVRRDVARRARVGVGAPDAADGLAPFEDLEVLDPDLAKPDLHPDAPEAAAYDPDRDLAPVSVAAAHPPSTLAAVFGRGAEASPEPRGSLAGPRLAISKRTPEGSRKANL